MTRSIAAAMLLVFATASVPVVARAQDKEACVASSESAQKLRSQKKLRGARKELVRCAQESCPGVVKKDCVTWLKEVDDSLPTVILSAKDGDGNDITDVKVSFDGEILAEKLDGSPIAVDPGAHTFRFEATGSTLPSVETKVIVRETEKNRVISATIGAKTKPIVEKPVEAKAPPRGPDAAPSRALPTGAYVFGAVAAASFVGFAYFGLSGRADRDRLRDNCAPYCNKDDEKPARTKLVLADVALGVGIVSLGIATVMILAAPKEPQKTGLRVDAVPIAGGAVGMLAGSF